MRKVEHVDSHSDCIKRERKLWTVATAVWCALVRLFWTGECEETTDLKDSEGRRGHESHRCCWQS